MSPVVKTDLPDTLCYLNGDYTPLQDAKISVMAIGETRLIPARKQP